MFSIQVGGKIRSQEGSGGRETSQAGGLHSRSLYD